MIINISDSAKQEFNKRMKDFSENKYIRVYLKDIT